MALLNRDQIRVIVFKSLETVADLPLNPEEAHFEPLTNFQKHIFLSTLKRLFNTSPYYMNDGTTTLVAYYDIHLKPDSTDEWPLVKDCINWIYAAPQKPYNFFGGFKI